jgi:hypothetical protein
MAPKAPTTSKRAGVASSKATSTPTGSVPKAGAFPRAGPPPKATKLPKAVVSKSTATQAVPTARVLRISIGMKRPSSVEPS